jgi:CDP-paratose 2-epimerase
MIPFPNDGRPVLITGGAGFIGTNLAHRLLTNGFSVRLFDNLSRSGVERNLRWLLETHGEALELRLHDVREASKVAAAVDGASRVFHFAAQVAVTTSLIDPVDDFECNARGTLNVLEAIRALPDPPPVVFTSTNKVYGGLDDLDFQSNGRRYEPSDLAIRQAGINESRPLDFHSPYGCSKGSADQYVLDYARTFGLPALLFRMSCIYGPHQYGNEDQGWVAHFLIRMLEGKPITLYGDGHQVRDLLFVEDLIDAMVLAQARMEELRGKAYNLGGGPANAVSLLELLDMMTAIDGSPPEVTYDDWRPGDQRYYVTDTSRFSDATGWRARVGVEEGVERLYTWLLEARRSRFSRHKGPERRAGRSVVAGGMPRRL